MSFLRLVLISGVLSILLSCTGQSPAKIKNSTIPDQLVKSECDNLKFEGKVFTQQNILDIFACTGWSKLYPELTQAIKVANTKDMNNVLSVINESFTSNKTQQKIFFKWLTRTQQAGEFDELSKLLERSLGDHRLMQQVTKVLEGPLMSEQSKSAFMKVLSARNEDNLKLIVAVKNFMYAFEDQKETLSALFEGQDEAELRKKIITIMDEFASKMAPGDWVHVAKIVHDKESSLQKWALRGKDADLRPLLSILEEENFDKDVTFIRSAIDNGLRCKNRADKNDFFIDVAFELKSKMDDLSSNSKEELERSFLDCMAKFVVFNEFCEEREEIQGLDSFHSVLSHAFHAIASEHDYLFLRDIHRNFGEDRFKFISFLTSNTFKELRGELIRLKDNDDDEKFVRALYHLLTGMTDIDLTAVSDLAKGFGTIATRSHEWMIAWSELWRRLEFKDKDEFINLLTSFGEKDLKISKVASGLEELMTAFPGFSTRLAKNLATNDYQSHTRYVISVLSRPKVQKELSKMLSGKGLFQVLELLTRESRRRTPPRGEFRPEMPVVTYVEPTTPSVRSQLNRQCFEVLSAGYRANSSYYTLVNELPESCQRALGHLSFVGQIYLWMNSSNTYFNERYGVRDFHAGSGVWSPGMLQFIFSAAVNAEEVLTDGQGHHGIKNNLKEIHRVTTHPYVLESLHRFSLLYKHISSSVNVDRNLLTYFDSRTNEALNGFAQNIISMSETAPVRVDLTIVPGDCRRLQADLGANPCLPYDEKFDHVLKIARILKRKNENNNSLIKELLKWVHPKAGIPLPFNKRKTSVHQTSLDEILRFLIDLSSTKTNKDFILKGRNFERKKTGTVIDRLEILIRDISFENNFYGAFYKNLVGSGEQYRRKVIKSEKLLNMLASGSGVFRGANALSTESKWQLRNVQQTYSSLVELSDIYPQPDGSTRSYGAFIQSLLTAIGESSKLSTQNFNAYSIPNSDKVNGHNGLFLSELVRMSALRHLGDFVRNRFGDNLDALNGKDFKQINDHLISRHDLTTLQNSLQSLLDKYLDNDRNQLNLLIEDILGFSQDLTQGEQEAFEEISVKVMLLLSGPKISTATIAEVAGSMEIMIESWPEIRSIIKQVGHKKKMLSGLSDLLDSLLERPLVAENIVNEIFSAGLLSRAEFRSIISKPEFRSQIIQFMIHALDSEGPHSTLNWNETLQRILGRSSLEWEPLKDWFRHALSGKSEKLTLSLLIEFLGEKNGEGYRFKRMMDELFLNHRDKLHKFLIETFPSLRVGRSTS